VPNALRANRAYATRLEFQTRRRRRRNTSSGSGKNWSTCLAPACRATQVVVVVVAAAAQGGAAPTARVAAARAGRHRAMSGTLSSLQGRCCLQRSTTRTAARALLSAPPLSWPARRRRLHRASAGGRRACHVSGPRAHARVCTRARGGEARSRRRGRAHGTPLCAA
jgi:hypothetical protein